MVSDPLCARTPPPLPHARDSAEIAGMSVYAVTASAPAEPSYATYYDSKRGTYLGDLFSVAYLEDSDSASGGPLSAPPRPDDRYPYSAALVPRTTYSGFSVPLFRSSVPLFRLSVPSFRLWVPGFRIGESTGTETLAQQFVSVKKKTNQSTAEQYPALLRTTVADSTQP